MVSKADLAHIAHTGEDVYKGAYAMVPVDAIEELDSKQIRYRPLDKENLAVLSEGIPMEGQKTPIQLEPIVDDKGQPTDRYGLIAGRHRLEVFRQLNRKNAPEGDKRFEEIFAFVYDQPLPSAEERQLAMVRENTTRRQLSPEFTIKAYKVWRKVHPRQRSSKGEAGDSERQNPNSRSDEFAARVFGVSPATIKNWNDQIRAEVDPKVAARLKGQRERFNAIRTETAAKVRAERKGVAYKPPAPEEGVKLDPNAVGDVSQLDELIEKGEPPSNGQRVESAVRGLLDVVLLPEFGEAAYLVFKDAPDKKMQAIGDVLTRLVKERRAQAKERSKEPVGEAETQGELANAPAA